MIRVEVQRELTAAADGVWMIVAATDDEPRYWPGLSELRTVRREGLVSEREVSVRRGPLGKMRSRQRIELRPERTTVLLTMTGGPMHGTRSIVISSLGPTRTSIDVVWEVRIEGMPRFAERFVETSLRGTTRIALDRIGELALKRLPSMAPRNLVPS